jgi:hypothetical protein
MVTLLKELIEGPPSSGGYMLNPGDQGLFRSLDHVSAADASKLTPSGSSIAANVDHLRYGFSLMNGWSQGENPFGGADWADSWKKTSVSEDQWRHLRADLQAEATRWLDAVGQPREVSDEGLSAMVGSIAHLAYHLGAMRQISPAARGPREESNA